jgi:hypothetical protein
VWRLLLPSSLVLTFKEFVAGPESYSRASGPLLQCRCRLEDIGYTQVSCFTEGLVDEGFVKGGAMTERYRGEESTPPAERRAEEAAPPAQPREEEAAAPEERGGEEAAPQEEPRREEITPPEVKRPPRE